jgi:hypothetical protein
MLLQIPPAPAITTENSLWIYGPLGLALMFLAAAVGFLWRALQAERAEHRKLAEDQRREFLKQLEDARKEFLAQMEVLLEREREGSVTMSTKYHTLAENLHLVLEKLENRLRGRVEAAG